MESRTVILFDSLEEPPPATCRVPASQVAYLVAQTLPPDEDDSVDDAW